jgi:hypothetical protein
MLPEIFSFSWFHTVHSLISIRRGLSLFSHRFFATMEKPPWGAEPGLKLGPAIQQASALPDEPRFSLDAQMINK